MVSVFAIIQELTTQAFFYFPMFLVLSEMTLFFIAYFTSNPRCKQGNFLLALLLTEWHWLGTKVTIFTWILVIATETGKRLSHLLAEKYANRLTRIDLRRARQYGLEQSFYPRQSESERESHARSSRNVSTGADRLFRGHVNSQHSRNDGSERVALRVSPSKDGEK